MSLVAINAVGPQDDFLSTDATTTFFADTFTKSTRYAQEEFIVPFQSSLRWGAESTAILPRSAQILNDCFLRVQLPTISPGPAASTLGWHYVNEVGHAMIEEIRLEIGQVEIDSHNGELLHILNELLNAPLNKNGASIGRFDRLGDLHHFSRTSRVDASGYTEFLYIPLRFFFTRALSLGLPLCALYRNDVKLRLKLADWSRVVMFTDNTTPASPIQGTSRFLNGTAAVLPSAVDPIIDIVAKYTFLMDEEKAAFMSPPTPLQYLVEYMQRTAGDTVGAGQTKLDSTSTFNNTVKYVLSVFQPTAMQDLGHTFTYMTVQNGLLQEPMKRMKASFNSRDVGTWQDPSVWRKLELLDVEHFTGTPHVDNTLTHREGLSDCTLSQSRGQAIYIMNFADLPEDCTRGTGQVNYGAIPTAKIGAEIAPLTLGTSAHAIGTDALTVGTVPVLGGEWRQYAMTQNIARVDGGTFMMKWS